MLSVAHHSWGLGAHPAPILCSGGPSAALGSFPGCAGCGGFPGGVCQLLLEVADLLLRFSPFCSRVFKTDMELEVLRYTNKISSEAHQEVSWVLAHWTCRSGWAGEAALLCVGQDGGVEVDSLGGALVPSRQEVSLQTQDTVLVVYCSPAGTGQGGPVLTLRYPPSGNFPARSPDFQDSRAFPPRVLAVPVPLKESVVLNQDSSTFITITQFLKTPSPGSFPNLPTLPEEQKQIRKFSF